MLLSTSVVFRTTLTRTIIFLFIILLFFFSTAQPEIRDARYYYVRETTDIKLPCNFKRNVSEEYYVAYFWVKDWKPISPERHNRMSVKSPRTLKITNVQKDDAGIYICIVEGKCGETNFVSMRLKVRERKYLVIVGSLNGQSYASCKYRYHIYSNTKLRGSYKKK